MSVLLNAAIFQVGWFASILCAANGMPWFAVCAALAVVAAHLALTPAPKQETQLALAATLIGLAWENALALAGWTRFEGGALIAGTAPLWMVAQWTIFATTLNFSLAWLKGNLAAAALFGAIGAPISYLAGERLGALQMPDHAVALTALAIGWAVITPIFMMLARHWSGAGAAQSGSPSIGARHA